jgi:hypothetical protein
VTDIKAQLEAAIAHWGPLLHLASTGINPYAVLRGIAHVESDDGARWQATLHEPAYCYGGRYYGADTPGAEDLRRLSVPYGCLAHSSWGPWQMLFITAYEEGFRDDPVRLRDPIVSGEFVVKYLNRTLDAFPDTKPEDLADAWNSGHARDKFIPTAYVEKFMEAYRALPEAGVTG